MKAILALADGTVFEGKGFGAETEAAGEVCFNTSMTGYQEILTDPSYAGQIVTLTYPEIGNYGINPEDVESRKIQPAALVVKNLCPYPSNWRNTENLTLDAYLKAAGIPGIQGIDTRKLVRLLRQQGVTNGVIAVGNYDKAAVIAQAKAVASLSDTDYVKQVTLGKSESWDLPEHPLSYRPIPDRAITFRIAALDFGAKHNILRKLRTLGAEVIRFPATASAEEIMAVQPDGIFLSNGPGDPAILDYAVTTIKSLLATGLPLFGICLGHQLLARALGAKTFKLKFGHRGANHPVQDKRTGKVEITSQNHGFAVDPESIDPTVAEITHINLNDGTVAGLRHRELPAFSVQYHPEASPGPQDSHYLFEEFLQALQTRTGAAV
jgi:carbamoyl-phosphate synthase small subunit